MHIEVFQLQCQCERALVASEANQLKQEFLAMQPLAFETHAWVNNGLMIISIQCASAYCSSTYMYIHTCIVEPLYYGHHWDRSNCLDFTKRCP